MAIKYTLNGQKNTLVRKNGNKWKVILKLGKEIYRIKINTEIVRKIKFSYYKYDRFNDLENKWSTDIAEGKRMENGKLPVILLNSIRSIIILHIETFKPDNIFYVLNKGDSGVDKKRNIYTYFLQDLERMDFKIVKTDQFGSWAFFGIKKGSPLADKSPLFFKRDTTESSLNERVFMWFLGGR